MANVTDYESFLRELNRDMSCKAQAIYRANGVLNGSDPSTSSVSLFLIQLTFSLIMRSLLNLTIKPFNLPPFVGEFLAGIFMGSSGLGRIDAYRMLIFPNHSFQMLETMGHFGICFYAVLVGAKMNPKAFLRMKAPKVKSIVVSRAIIPFLVGAAIYFLFSEDDKTGLLFVASALTVTDLLGLKKIIEYRRIFHYEVCTTLLEACEINEMTSWVLLGLSMLLCKNALIYNMCAAFGFVFVSLRYFRSIICRIIEKKYVGHGYTEFFLCSFVFIGMSIFGIITELIGIHPIIGCFMFGFIIPNKGFGEVLVKKFEDFVVAVLLPVFIVVCGLKTKVDSFPTKIGWVKAGSAIFLACLAKLISSIFVFIHGAFPLKEAMVAGLLGNTKSVTALVIMELGLVKQVLHIETYSVMVIALLLMTMITIPFTMWFRAPIIIPAYEHRTIQKSKQGEELRMFACIHNFRNVQTILNLLHTSNSTPSSFIYVYALELLEMKGHASTTTLAHISKMSQHKIPTHTNQILNSFYRLQLQYEGVWTQTLSARASYSTMGVDICKIAKDKYATFIIVPFHKLPTYSRGKYMLIEDINPSLRAINEIVLARAPCSVGILVDKGLGNEPNLARNIALLYFGGPDDREALAYALRIVEKNTPRDYCKITIVRFVAGEPEDAMPTTSHPPPLPTHKRLDVDDVKVDIEAEMETVLDDEYLGWFKSESLRSLAINYHELVLKDAEETATAIKSMDEAKFDMFMVGRGQGMVSPLTERLVGSGKYPELGPVGDMLVTTMFRSPCLVLIFQQYRKKIRKTAITTTTKNDG